MKSANSTVRARDISSSAAGRRGKSAARDAEARLSSTTSQNLDEEMRAGRFRSELYYGSMVFVCGFRRSGSKGRHSADERLFCGETLYPTGKVAFGLSARTLETFLEYSWPGNIRELENMVKKIVALGDENLAPTDLVELQRQAVRARSPLPTRSLKVAARAASREAERELILKALGRTRWNRKRAAQELQISYKSLLYKLKQIGMDEESNSKGGESDDETNEIVDCGRAPGRRDSIAGAAG